MKRIFPGDNDETCPGMVACFALPPGRAVLLFFSLTVLNVLPAIAHGPTGMQLEYDPEKREATLFIRHKSGERDEHYIRHFDIFKNGERLRRVYRRMQDYVIKGRETFEIGAEHGDIISLKAYCSEGGTKSVSVQVEDPEKDDDANETAIQPEAPPHQSFD